MPRVSATILGGLPVIADVSFGVDDFTGEGWSEVDGIYWQKKNGEPGARISQHLLDKAEKYDPYFAELTERASEHLAYERDGGDSADPVECFEFRL